MRQSVITRALRIIALLPLLVSTMMQAQTIVVEGHIADGKTGQSLPMASVKSSGGVHTISNGNGAFKITAETGDRLTFSYLGYQKKTIVAGKVSGTVKLEPSEYTLKEVSVMSTDKRIEAIIRTARKQLTEHKGEQSTFFYRQLSLVNERPSSLTEAFINARSAMQIRHMELITGRYTTPPNDEANQTYAGNFIAFSQIGMIYYSRNEQEWEDIVPLSSNYKSFYNVSLDIAGDCYVLRFKPKRNHFRPIIDCTLFVDMESMHLRKAVGTVKQMEIRHNAGTHKEFTLPIRMKFTCLYNSDRGFCEVQSIATDIQYQTEETDYTFQSTLYNVGQGAIKDARPMGRVTDLRTQIAAVPFVRSFWDEHETVKRTEMESSLDAGTPSAAQQLGKWVSNMERFNQLFPQEKVYLHLDNSGYFMGETIWMKAYVVRADNNGNTNLSRVLYVDLVSPTGEVAATRKLMIENGEAEGSIELKGLIGSGFYEVRAYTRYMLNWDDLGVCSRVIPIFKEPQKEGDYSHAVIDKTDYRHRLPDYRKDSEDTKATSGKMNVRFYPEGGQMIMYRKGKVAFEVTDGQGRGIRIKGKVMVGGNVIEEIQTGMNGRGLFSLRPTEEPARLILTKENGHEETFELPEASASGASLAVNAIQDAKIAVTINASADLNGVPLGLLLMNNGNVNAFAVVTTVNDSCRTAFRREELDEGVNRLLLFDQTGNILSDRMFFIYPKESVDSITFIAGNEPLRPSRKVSLTAKTRPNSRFSVAIHDHDTEVNGRLQRADSWLLLASELRGYIDNADYYLEADDTEHRQATDLLMMVQGWHRYNVRQMMTQRRLEKQQFIEDKLVLSGQLKNKKSKTELTVDSVNLKAILYNRLGQTLQGETQTDSLGHFLFTIPDCVGPWRMQLRTTKYGKPQDFYISIDRQPDVKPRRLGYGEQQPSLSTHQPLEALKAADNFEEEIPMELRNHLLTEVTVKGKNRYMNGWDDESVAARKASLQYDSKRAMEEYADKGLTTPNLFQWLKDRNEFFSGDEHNIFEDTYGWYLTENKIYEEYELFKKYPSSALQNGHRDELMEVYKMRNDLPRCDDEYCSNIQAINFGAHYIGALVNDLSFRPHLLPHAGLSYKGRPVVWVLNNAFFAITQSPQTFGPIDIEWMTEYSVERMPDQLEDIKTVYVSEDDNVWKRYILSTRLESFHPVTVFLYSDGASSKSEKGVRNTYFEGFSVDTYEMPGYTELPAIADFRRTLYWNPDVQTDQNGNATIEFFNSGTCKHINISAEGITSDGHVVVYR